MSIFFRTGPSSLARKKPPTPVKPVFSALTTQPLAHGPDWPRLAARQLAIFVAGLASPAAADIPGPPVSREDIETAFASNARG
ncbi:MAG TPA: hypothetical protein VGH77_00160 [Streptosporangiaceae bacterium]